MKHRLYKNCKLKKPNWKKKKIKFKSSPPGQERVPNFYLMEFRRAGTWLIPWYKGVNTQHSEHHFIKTASCWWFTTLKNSYLKYSNSSVQQAPDISRKTLVMYSTDTLTSATLSAMLGADAWASDFWGALKVAMGLQAVMPVPACPRPWLSQPKHEWRKW